MLFYDKLKKKKSDHVAGGRIDGAEKKPNESRASQLRSNNTNIQECIEAEMEKYFELLDGQAPHDLYRMVMSQVERTLVRYVLEECGNNQSRAAEYLGISRGTLRTKLTEQGLI